MRAQHLPGITKLPTNGGDLGPQPGPPGKGELPVSLPTPLPLRRMATDASHPLTLPYGFQRIHPPLQTCPATIRVQSPCRPVQQPPRLIARFAEIDPLLEVFDDPPAQPQTVGIPDGTVLEFKHGR